MNTEDAVELARNVKTLAYGEWTDVVEGMFFLTCSECGNSHAVLIKDTGPQMQRVRIVHEAALTDAAREFSPIPFPLYEELITKRERVKELEAELATIIEGNDNAKTPDTRSAIDRLADD